MNQTQFLTYGLLNIFIKEIFNNGLRGEDKLLCSYHVKTGIFWAIQPNMLLHWCPQNLLVGFWVCFKLLLKWVYEGVCPNFFIPQNNMFLNNIHGEAQWSLFMRLYRCYEKGIAFLYHSLSIGSYLFFDLCVPRFSVNADVRFLILEAVYDGELFREISMYDSIHIRLRGLYEIPSESGTVCWIKPDKVSNTKFTETLGYHLSVYCLYIT